MMNKDKILLEKTENYRAWDQPCQVLGNGKDKKPECYWGKPQRYGNENKVSTRKGGENVKDIIDWPIQSFPNHPSSCWEGAPGSSRTPRTYQQDFT